MSQDDVLRAMRSIGRPARTIEISRQTGIGQPSVLISLRALARHGEVRYERQYQARMGENVGLWELI